MTEPESGGADTVDPQTQTTATRTDAPPKRPRWRKPAGAAAATVVLAVIAVGGYFNINASLPHPSRHTTPKSTPSTTEHMPPYLPPGAARCQRIYPDVPGRFNASARGTPATSCAFAEEARKEYGAQSPQSPGPTDLRVLSPATRKWYDLACLSSGDYVTCTGGAAAVIYLYHSSGSNRQG